MCALLTPSHYLVPTGIPVCVFLRPRSRETQGVLTGSRGVLATEEGFPCVLVVSRGRKLERTGWPLSRRQSKSVFVGKGKEVHSGDGFEESYGGSAAGRKKGTTVKR